MLLRIKNVSEKNSEKENLSGSNRMRILIKTPTKPLKPFNRCPQKRSDVSDLICLVNQLYYEIKESTLEIRSLTFCGAVVAEE